VGYGLRRFLPMECLEEPLGAPAENQVIGRAAAAVWGAIALAGAVATIGPLQIPGSDVTLMRQIAAFSAVCGGISFVVPWARLPRAAFSVGLVVMSAAIAALVSASGAADSALTILFTFVAALAASFMPVRASVAQLGVIAALLIGLVVVVGSSDSTHIDVLRVTLLLATMVVLCGLVLVMRAMLDERALGLRGRSSDRFRAVLLDGEHLQAALDTELSRAGRHERPLSVLMLEITGSAAEVEGRRRRGTLAAVTRAIVSRIRIEDSVGRLSGLRFVVVAPETTASGAAAMGNTVAGVVRQRLMVAGFEPETFSVDVGWAEFPHRATTRDGLLAAAQAAIEATRSRTVQPAEQGGASTEPATGPV
jgi:GGDEF domain-containing protein